MSRKTKRVKQNTKKKRYSRKYLKKYRNKSKKYKKNIKKYRKKNKRTQKKKILRKKRSQIGGANLFNDEELKQYTELLSSKPHGTTEGMEWYANPENIDEFLQSRLTSTNDAKVNLENKKEVRIASFTNYYRKSIYELVKIIDDYLNDLADVVVSGGDGLNNILKSKDRLVSPDVDVKVIIKDKYETITKDNWLNIYRLVIIMTEYIVDYIVCCLNGSYPDEFIEIPSLQKPSDIADCDTIKALFYHGSEPFNFHISEEEFTGFFQNTLLHVDAENFYTIGKPWNRRTSNMKAGGKEPPFTLMNVKLIAIDLRFTELRTYFSSLAGVLDIVIAVPGHIGHNGMLDNGYKPINPFDDPTISINCITMEYYIYEMVKMISYGLRIRNGKLVKDLGRCNTLLRIDATDCENVKTLPKQAIVSMNHKEFPEHLKKKAECLIKSIGTFIKEETEELIVKVMDEIKTKITSQTMWEKVKQSLPILNTEFDSQEDVIVEPGINNPKPNPDAEFSPRGSFIKNKSGNLINADGDVELDNDDEGKRVKSCSGGGWLDENTDSVGKTFESLNIFDFFNFLPQIQVISINGEQYNITLIQHDKIYGDVLSNYQDGDLSKERIDYEKLQENTIQREHYDILCREPFMLYSYGRESMDVTSNSLCTPVKDIFNTSKILICKEDAQIAADVLRTITLKLNEDENRIIYLAQFRYFPNQFGSKERELHIDETQLYAMFLFSSVIRGMNPIKLLYQKKNFRNGVLGDIEIPPYNILNIPEIIKIIMSNHDDNGFKILAKELVNFYIKIAKMAIPDIPDDQIFR